MNRAAIALRVDPAYFVRGMRAAMKALRDFARSVRLYASPRGIAPGRLTLIVTASGALSYCRKCGQRKSPLDSSPCGACVAKNVKEAEDIYKWVVAERSRPVIGEGI